MREPSGLTYEEYKLMKVSLAREDVPADAFTRLSTWINEENLLVDDRENVGGIEFSRMDAKIMTHLPHIIVSFFARLPYKRKAGHYPRWNGFYLLLYRDVEEGWKLIQIRKNTSVAQFTEVDAARLKAVQEIKKRLGNDHYDESI